MKQQTSVKIIHSFIRNLDGFKNYSVKPTDNGVSTDVFKLVNGDVTLYLRLSNPDENLSTEALAHNLILEKGVQAARVVAHEDFNEQLNRSYMITTEIKGVSAKEDKSNLREVSFKAGQQIALVNQILVDGFGWFDWKTPNIKVLRGEYSSWKDFALDQNRIEDMLKDLVDRETLDITMAKKYLNYIETNKDLVVCIKAHLAHGDFGLDHIYVYKGKYSGIIDFGDIRATSIYHDLAHFYTYCSEEFENLLRGYLDVTPLEESHREKIEFVAMLFVIGKLWWVTKNLPNTLNRRRDDFKLLKCVLGLN